MSVALLPTAIWPGVVAVQLVCCELLLCLLPCLLQDHVCCNNRSKMLASGEEGCSGLFEWEHSQGNQAGCVLPPIGQHQVQAWAPMLQSDGAILDILQGLGKIAKNGLMLPTVLTGALEDLIKLRPQLVDPACHCPFTFLLGPSAEGVDDLVQEVGG